jgi:hypothetical protein
MEENFTERDIKYIQERGNSLDKIKQQLFYFKNGIPKINLVKPAKINDGIVALNVADIKFYADYFDVHKVNYSIEKFVPASGAASRMFKFLNEFLHEFNIDESTINSYINTHKKKDLALFIYGFKNFPFYIELKEKTLELHPDYYSFTTDKKYFTLIKTLLSEEGLNFAQKPKGILPFHVDKSEIITPTDKNILEASFYKKGVQETKIHFTINREFQTEFQTIVSKYSDLDVSFSYQETSTDTLAVNKNNMPFRLEDGSLFFRPGGHGALIDNLNQLQSQIIYLKNIDNVSLNNEEIISNYKKILGAILIKTQLQIFAFLNKLESDEVSEKELEEIIKFTEAQLSFPLSEDFMFFKKSYKVEYLRKVLNRPIRVCGMVRNEGEPGGGPFWVQDNKGRQTLQIVESSQIDSSNENQMRIAKSATHFNPVDIVCGVYDYKGQKFNLNQFIDHDAAFISEKNKNGIAIKAFELPGLWNGAMAKWTTIFVEVPLETFNPVKTVNDLLKPAHQSNNE